MISIAFTEPLPLDSLLPYNFVFDDARQKYSLAQLLPELLYPQSSFPNLVIKSDIKQMLHGSCRKPHYPSKDSLAEVDRLLTNEKLDATTRPAMLMMTGDQIYADDVAGPMLVAIHQVIELLGLYGEEWQGAKVNNSEALFNSPLCYYKRDKLLPNNSANKAVYDKIFAAAKKPIFTTDTSKNHLITLAEVFAMYILVWSPTMWRFVNLQSIKIDKQFSATYQQEMAIIEDFTTTLPAVSRGLAHLPVYMIFDDHDITDDWNLTRGWEEAAYGHPFSKRIIGNALIAYWLCQGWGNAPDKFTTFNQQAEQYFQENSYVKQDLLIDKLL
ncbi:MAG: alkaline phosphatase family protein, partial [Psychromonas sp.]